MHLLTRSARATIAALFSLCLLATPLLAAPARPQLQVTGYVINADLDPSVNRLSATAAVTFTALEDLTAPIFELNNGLQITKVTDANRKPLEAERLTNNSTVRFSLANPIPKGTSTTYYFEYSGTLKGADTSPVEGIKLASVEDPISILLYPGRWFPMVGLFTNRFTAEMHIRVPSDQRVVGSGSGVAAAKSVPATALSILSIGLSPASRELSSRANSSSPSLPATCVSTLPKSTKTTPMTSPARRSANFSLWPGPSASRNLPASIS